MVVGAEEVVGGLFTVGVDAVGLLFTSLYTLLFLRGLGFELLNLGAEYPLVWGAWLASPLALEKVGFPSALEFLGEGREPWLGCPWAPCMALGGKDGLKGMGTQFTFFLSASFPSFLDSFSSLERLFAGAPSLGVDSLEAFAAPKVGNATGSTVAPPSSGFAESASFFHTGFLGTSNISWSCLSASAGVFSPPSLRSCLALLWSVFSFSL